MSASTRLALVLAAVLTFVASGSAAAGPSLQPRGSISAPVAFHAFCSTFPDQCARRHGAQRRVVMTSPRWRELKRVNAEINHGVRARTDVSVYGQADVWTLTEVGASGDCEDFALLKRARLIEAGWPSSVLLMTVVRDRSGEGHAVLTVVTDQGDLILDNRTGSILTWNNTGYRFYTRQSQTNPRNWVVVGDWQKNNSRTVATTATER